MKPLIRNTTSELAARAVGGHYDLVLIAAKRLRELRHGKDNQPRVEPQSTDISTVLTEIEQGQTGREYLDKKLDLLPEYDNSFLRRR